MNRDQILSALRERILAFATSRVSRDHAEDLPLADTADDPVTQLDQKQRVDRLLAAVAQLGERCRELFK
ncbi:MAG: hypothetical protein ACXW4A_11100 [Nitrospira sp.]